MTLPVGVLVGLPAGLPVGLSVRLPVGVLACLPTGLPVGRMQEVARGIAREVARRGARMLARGIARGIARAIATPGCVPRGGWGGLHGVGSAQRLRQRLLPRVGAPTPASLVVKIITDDM